MNVWAEPFIPQLPRWKQREEKPFPLFCDIRDEKLIQEVIEKTVEAFGGLDVVINNASAINISNTEMIEPKRFDLLFDINVRGTFMVTKYALPPA